MDAAGVCRVLTVLLSHRGRRASGYSKQYHRLTEVRCDYDGDRAQARQKENWWIYTTVGSARRYAQHYPWKHKETTRPVEMRDGKPMKFDPQHTKSVSAPRTETEESAMSKDHNAVADRIQRSFWVVDRGPRPLTR